MEKKEPTKLPVGKYSHLRRFVIRQYISGLVIDGYLDVCEDWFWEALFEIFTYE